MHAGPENPVSHEHSESMPHTPWPLHPSGHEVAGPASTALDASSTATQTDTIVLHMSDATRYPLCARRGRGAAVCEVAEARVLDPMPRARLSRALCRCTPGHGITAMSRPPAARAFAHATGGPTCSPHRTAPHATGTERVTPSSVWGSHAGATVAYATEPSARTPDAARHHGATVNYTSVVPESALVLSPRQGVMRSPPNPELRPCGGLRTCAPSNPACVVFD